MRRRTLPGFRALVLPLVGLAAPANVAAASACAYRPALGCWARSDSSDGQAGVENDPRQIPSGMVVVRSPALVACN